MVYVPGLSVVPPILCSTSPRFTVIVAHAERLTLSKVTVP
jgi:hypothetical protein